MWCVPACVDAGSEHSRNNYFKPRNSVERDEPQPLGSEVNKKVF